jgi:hypothetical protein
MAKKKVTKKAKIKKQSPKMDKTPWLILSIILIIIGSFSLARKQVMAPNLHVSIYPQMHMGFDFASQKYMINHTVQQSAQIEHNVVNPANTRGAAILIDNSDGSGTFYYLIGAMRKEKQDIYSAPIMLGDRIKILSVSVSNPQTYDNGVISVQYLDRSINAPMATEPTIPMTKKYTFQNNGNLIEVKQ